jgi:hypothetical protein
MTANDPQSVTCPPASPVIALPLQSTPPAARSLSFGVPFFCLPIFLSNFASSFTSLPSVKFPVSAFGFLLPRRSQTKAGRISRPLLKSQILNPQQQNPGGVT